MTSVPRHRRKGRSYGSLYTLSRIERETGVHRRDVKTLIVSHGVPHSFRPPALVVSPEGMAILMPILDDFKAKDPGRARAG